MGWRQAGTAAYFETTVFLDYFKICRTVGSVER